MFFFLKGQQPIECNWRETLWKLKWQSINSLPVCEMKNNFVTILPGGSLCKTCLCIRNRGIVLTSVTVVWSFALLSIPLRCLFLGSYHRKEERGEGEAKTTFYFFHPHPTTSITNTNTYSCSLHEYPEFSLLFLRCSDRLCIMVFN